MSSSLRLSSRAGVTAVLLSLAALPGCKQPAAPQTPPVPVKVMTIQSATMPLYRDYPGQVSGSDEATLRSRSNGILVAKHFEDGDWVRKGQPLFSIDPREMLAQQASAHAQLAQAQADLARARLDVARYGPLVRENAIARQVYDNSVAAERAAAAQVRAAEALTRQAGLGVEYTTVEAPFDGRIGAADISIGDLVVAGQTSLVTISKDDPAWVYFNPSESDFLAFRRQHGGKPEQPGQIPEENRVVRLILSDGSEYPLPGEIDFTDRALDSGTGTYRVRAKFPNSDRLLTPGMFARVRVQFDQRPQALAVPERAVVQMLGRYFLVVVGAGNKAEQRPIKPGPRQGSLWVIDKGLKPGETVVVEGMQKAAAGAVLAPTPVTQQQLDNPDAAASPAKDAPGQADTPPAPEPAAKTEG